MSDAASEKENLLHISGASLATFALLIHMMRLLQEKNVLHQDEVNLLVGRTLLSLQDTDLLSEPEVHAARSILSSLAEKLGVPLSKPN